MIAVAFVAFSARVGHEPLWLDETYTAAMVERGLFDVVRLTTLDVHPPLYYVLLELWTRLAGNSPTALRLLSVLAATGLVALGAGPVRRVWNARTGWTFAVITVFSSGVLCFAQEARMYALATLLVSGAALYGHLAVRDGRRGDFVAFAVFTAIAALTHYFALVAVGMNALVLLLGAGMHARQRLRPLLIASALATLAFLPWAPFFVRQLATVTAGFWIPPTSLAMVVFGLVAPFAYKFEDIAYPWQSVAALVIAATAITVTLISRRLRAARSAVAAQAQLLLVFASTLSFGLAFSFLIRPIFMPRYMIVCAGPLLLVAAAAIGRLPGKVGVAMTALLVLLGLPAWARVQLYTFNGPFLRLAHEVASAGGPVPVLVHNGVPYSFALLPTAHAVPHARNLVVVSDGAPFDPTSGGLYPAGRIEVVDSLTLALNDAQRLWIIDGSPGPDPVDTTAAASSSLWQHVAPDVTLEEPMSWVKLTVRRYERR